MQMLVLGMHRSGTSAVARVLNMMGAYFAPERVAMPPTALHPQGLLEETVAMPADEANPKGYWERRDVFNINENILIHSGWYWDRLSGFSADSLTPEIHEFYKPHAERIIMGLDAQRPWMIKDPRLCLTLPFWLPLLEVPVLIYVYRRPIQVARSLAKREGFSTHLGLALWEKYNLEGLTHTAHLPRVLVSYHELMRDPVATVKNLYEQLVNFEIQGLRLPSDREITAFIDPKLYRQQAEDTVQDAYINEPQRLLTSAFETNSIFDLSPVPDLSLGAEEVMQSYEHSYHTEQSHQAEMMQANQDKFELQNKINHQQQIIEHKEQIIVHHEQVTERQTQQITQQEQHIAAQQQQITAQEQQITTQSKKLEQQELLLQKSLVTQNQLSSYQTEISNYQNQIAAFQTNQLENRKMVAELSAKLENYQQGIYHLLEWNTALYNDAKAILNSLTWRSGNAITQVALRLMLRRPDVSAKDHLEVIMRDVNDYRSQVIPTAPTASVNSAKSAQANGVAAAVKQPDFMPPALTLPDLSLYERWYDQNACNLAELEAQRREISSWAELPLISIIIPTFNSTAKWLEELLFSIHSQTYAHWECLIIDDASSLREHLPVIEHWCRKDQRVRLIAQEHNQGVSNTSQRGVEEAQGEYFCIVDHDDLLEPQALFEMASAIVAHHPDVLYSDEMLINADGSMIKCVFRPNYSYHFLISHPYIVHLTLLRRALVLEVGGFTPDLAVSQDYDLLLKIAAKTDKFHHVPKVLYRWRTYHTSTGHKYKDQVMERSLASLNKHLRLKGYEEDFAWAEEGFSFNFFRVRYHVPATTVSVIIPTKDRADLLRTCIESFQTKTRIPTGVEIEFIVVDNNSSEKATLQYFDQLTSAGHIVLPEPGPFNYSYLNNQAVAQAKGDFLLFLNNDIEAIEDGWLEAMLELMALPEVGAVGAKLLYPNIGLIQHAGVIIGVNGPASHDHQFYPEYEPSGHWAMGHNHAMMVVRECMAVTAACLLVRRSAFEAIGGFDESLHVGFGDTDLCLKLWDKGYKCVFTPYARLIHHESATRGHKPFDPHAADSALFRKRWHKLITDGDPFYNPNLVREGRIFEPFIQSE